MKRKPDTHDIPFAHRHTVTLARKTLVLSLVVCTPVAHACYRPPVLKHYDEIECLHDGLASVQINGSHGYVDSTGKEVIPTRYDYARDFSDGLAAVRKKNGKWGFINKQGKVVIPFKYDFARRFKHGFSRVKITGDSILSEKQGLIDTQGNVVVPIEYRQVSDFSEGYASVKRYDGNGIAIINTRGEFITPYLYIDNIYSGFQNGLAHVTRSRKSGFINPKGDVVIPFKYDSARYFSSGLAPVSKHGKYGYIDTTGNVVIPFQYDYADAFQDGIANVKINGKRGMINTKGEVIVPIEHSWVGYSLITNFSQGVSKVQKKGLSALVDNTGKLLTDYRYYEIEPFHNGIARVITPDRKYGFITREGKALTDAFFDKAERFVDGKALVRRNGKSGVINTNGDWVIEPEYDVMGNFSDGLYYAEKEGEAGFLNAEGDIAIPFDYDVINPTYTSYYKRNNAFTTFKNNRFTLAKNKKAGVINQDGDTIIPFVYNALGVSKNGLFLALKHKKYGVINEHNRVVVPFEYDFLNWHDDNTLIFAENKKYGLIDQHNNTITPAQYDSIAAQKDGLYRVKKDSKYGYIDTKGKQIVPPEYAKSDLGKLKNDLILVKQKKKWGAYNRTGKQVLPFAYDEITRVVGTQQNIAMTQKDSAGQRSEKRYALLNAKGERVTKKDYSAIDRKPNAFGLLTVSYTQTESAAKRAQANRKTPEAKTILKVTKRPEQKTTRRRRLAEAVRARPMPRSMPKYQERIQAERLASGTTVAKIKEPTVTHKGMIDLTGNEVIPPVYHSIKKMNALGVTVISKKGKDGLVTHQGDLVLSTDYDDIEPVNDHAFIIKQDGIYGLITSQADTLLPLEYNRIEPLEDNNNTIASHRKVNGKTLLKVMQYNDDGIATTGIYELHKDKLTPVIAMQYGSLKQANLSKNTFLIAEQAGADDAPKKTGVLDVNGVMHVPLDYDSIKYDTDDVFIVEKNNKYGLIDTDNNPLTPLTYDEINNASESLMPVQSNGVWGVLKTDGTLVVQPQYYSMGEFGGGVAKVYKKPIGDYEGCGCHHALVGLIDSTGKLLVPMNYKEIEFFQNGYIVVKTEVPVDAKTPDTNDDTEIRYGLYSPKGKQLLNAEYDDISWDGEDRFSVIQGDKHFYINMAGKRVT